MKSGIEVFLDKLDELTGATGKFDRVTTDDELPAIWAISYFDLIEPNSLTSFTFGLSSGDHPAWKFGKPELVLHVRSTNIDWSITLGNLVRRFRGTCSFSYGSVLNFGRRITYDSEMSAFFVFASSLLDQKDAKIELPDRTVNLVQLYPIYEQEISLLERLGPTKFFFDTGLDFADIQRTCCSKIEF